MENQMLVDIIDNWLENTSSGIAKWEVTSSPYMFMIHDRGKVFSIEKKTLNNGESEYEVMEWGNNGDVLNKYHIKENDIHNKASDLYNVILNSNPCFQDRIKRLEVLDSVQKDVSSESVSLQKIKIRLGLETDGANEFVNIRDSESFYYVQDIDPHYVEPPFVQLESFKGKTPINEAEVILISAPGATGKSALSAYLSNKMNIPLFDLGKHPAVGSHSLIGLLVDNLSTEEYVRFKNGLGQKRFSMIIDGLDEGEIRSGSSAYESFLDDVVNIAKGAEGVPFLMLGRLRTVIDTAFYLESKDVRVVCLQIEPFTLLKAREFIDKALSNKNSAVRFEKSYNDVKNYIIDSVQGFFKNEGALRTQSFNRFIGYAPVLMAIVSLLEERQDFNKLLIELQEERRTNIDLLITIIEKILSREREKVEQKALPAILETYDTDFQKSIYERAYDVEEQCARILYSSLHKGFEWSISERHEFNVKYNEKMNEWTLNHPFLNTNDGSIQNIVFESYVVAKLASNKKYSQTVEEYLLSSRSNSYLLFDFYDRLVDESRFVNFKFLRYLYDSYRALDIFGGRGSMEIISTTQEEEFIEVHCEVSFYREGDVIEKEFQTDIPYDEEISLPSSLGGITVDVPLPVSCRTSRLDVKAPLNIRCTNMTVTSADVIIHLGDKDDIAIIECDKFYALQGNGKLPNVINRGNKNSLIIVSAENVLYPFLEYRRNNSGLIIDNKDFNEMFQKLRRTFMLFRSNGKESLARIQSKIHSRVCNTPTGRAVVNKLLSSGIIYSKGPMYILNTDEMNQQLGMSYNGIHSGEINEKIRTFLQDIEVEN